MRKHRSDASFKAKAKRGNGRLGMRERSRVTKSAAVFYKRPHP